MFRRIRKHANPASLLAIVALFVALGGVSYAAATIGSAQIAYAATNNQQYTDIATLVKGNYLDPRFGTAGQINGSDAKVIEVPMRGKSALTFSGETYLKHWALPNFYFHLTTAYALLRHNGVPLGKPDFLGRD